MTEQSPPSERGADLVLVTGANGFVGGYLCAELLARGYAVRAAVRRADAPLSEGVERCLIGDVGSDTDWTRALQGVDLVAHLAGRAHVLERPSAESRAAYRDVNVGGTESLARAAVRAGVRRILYLSSIKVNGERSERGFREDDVPAPEDDYGRTKHEAETRLRELCAGTPTEWTILRPPLVYGRGVKGNFARLLRLAGSGLPLPFASVRNRRSLVYVENLAHAIAVALASPAAAREVFLVSDGEPVSTAELLREAARALGRPARLFPLPPALLFGAASLIGKRSEADKLLGSLVVDSTKIRKKLSWSPPISFAHALHRTLLIS